MLKIDVGDEVQLRIIHRGIGAIRRATSTCADDDVQLLASTFILTTGERW